MNKVIQGDTKIERAIMVKHQHLSDNLGVFIHVSKQIKTSHYSSDHMLIKTEKTLLLLIMG